MLVTLALGYPPEAWDHFDDVLRRTHTEHLRKYGVSNGRLVSQIADRIAKQELRGSINDRHDMSDFDREEMRVVHWVGIKEAVDLVKDCPDGIPQAVLGFIYVGAKDKNVAEEFVTGVVTGAGLGRTDPRLIIRESLTINRPERYTTDVRNSFVVEAWNRFVCGQSMTRNDLPKPVFQRPIMVRSIWNE